MAVAVAVAVAVNGGGAVAVAGLTKRFLNHIQKDFLINVWVYVTLPICNLNFFRRQPWCGRNVAAHPSKLAPRVPHLKIFERFWNVARRRHFQMFSDVFKRFGTSVFERLKALMLALGGIPLL